MEGRFGVLRLETAGGHRWPIRRSKASEPTNGMEATVAVMRCGCRRGTQLGCGASRGLSGGFFEGCERRRGERAPDSPIEVAQSTSTREPVARETRRTSSGSRLQHACEPRAEEAVGVVETTRTERDPVAWCGRPMAEDLRIPRREWTRAGSRRQLRGQVGGEAHPAVGQDGTSRLRARSAETASERIPGEEDMARRSRSTARRRAWRVCDGTAMSVR